MRRIMEVFYSLLIIFFMADTCCSQTCKNANWWHTFDREGWSYCDSENQYITGLWRNDNKGSNDGIYLIEHAKCCFAPYGVHAQDIPASCKKANWWKVLDGTNKWATCPDGYFMGGLYRTGKHHWLHNIEEARCCKPVGLPEKYADCYDENVWSSFDGKGLSECKRKGYYMAGIFRGECDKLYCLEKFKCCRMIEIEGTHNQADETGKE